MTEYVTLIEALTFHADQIQRYGGDAGIRDPGALESALFRPQTGYYDDLIDEAAALWESMAQNHPFIDGNKRTAFAVTDVFLKMNGIMITASPEETTSFVYSLYDSQTFNFEELATWLRSNIE
jgi:death-on-curing protein